MNGVPSEVKGWNWGAFMFNMVWGIGNKTYLPLLCLVPIVNIVWPFICGFKGNEWAWISGGYSPSDIELFKAIQNTWNRAGLVWFVLSIGAVVLTVGCMLLLIINLANYI